MTRLEMYLRNGSSAFPRLLTAEEAAPFARIPATRLIELAEAHIVPHARIDGGPPLFYRPDLASFVKEEMLKVTPGRILPDTIVVYQAPRPAAIGHIPDPLLQYQDDLKVMVPEPGFPCVYFLILNAEIRYVGSTFNLPKRLQEHIADGKVFDRALYLLTQKADLLAREYQFIKALSPPLNSHHHGARNGVTADTGPLQTEEVL